MYTEVSSFQRFGIKVHSLHFHNQSQVSWGGGGAEGEGGIFLLGNYKWYI